MKVILLGATGMVGQGVLRECLLDPEVTTTECVGRTMLNFAKRGALKTVVENKDINSVCRDGS